MKKIILILSITSVVAYLTMSALPVSSFSAVEIRKETPELKWYTDFTQANMNCLRKLGNRFLVFLPEATGVDGAKDYKPMFLPKTILKNGQMIQLFYWN